MTLPRILVIDDQITNEPDRRGSFCHSCGLAPIDVDTSDEELQELAEEGKLFGGQPALAGAVFSSGQVRVGDSTENSIEEVLRVVKSGWPSAAGWSWALVLLDLRFDSKPARSEDSTFGLRISEELVQNWPDTEAQTGNSNVPIIMLSSELRGELGNEPNRAGVRAYVEKEELTRAKLHELLQEHGLLADPSGNLIGRSLALLKVLRAARRVAQMRTGNAMILGPQGSGKSSLARYIHEQSGRGKRGAAFVEYFSTPSAKELEYPALFGYWVGAHNMAKNNARGAVEEAHRGTLLIDEVHNLANETQQQLLQFCRPDNEGRRWFRRLGNFPVKGGAEARDSVRGLLDNTYRIAVDVMLLSATNERIDDPNWRAAHGFSEPLYTRLAVDFAGEPLRFPSLAKRREDIPLLFEYFLTQETEKIGGRTNEQRKKLLDAEVADWLRAYDWPANVAELRGVAHQAARNAKDFPVVFARHLPKFEWPVPPIPDRDEDDTADLRLLPATNSLAEAELALRNIQMPHALSEELQGRLASLEDAYARVIKNVLEVALEQMRVVRGDDRFCLPALRFLFGKDEIKTAAQAYSKVLSLYKLFKKTHPPAPGSALAITIERAKKNRTMAGRSSKEDEEEE